MMQGEPLTILLIEDDDAQAELVMRNLENNRMANRVLRFSDGEQALDYLFQWDAEDPTHRPPPHLILLDLRLPKVDGLDVLKEIRSSKLLAKTPVIVLTVSEAAEDIGRAYEQKANNYLVKPFSFEKFSEILNEMGFYWLAWTRPPWPDKKP
ncbi:MAG: response regulator [Nitrospinales bacterium]